MMIPGVKFKNVQNPISVSTLKFWGWLGFFLKKSRNTIHVEYFRKALGTSTSKMMIPGVKFKKSNMSQLNKFLVWLGFPHLMQRYRVTRPERTKDEVKEAQKAPKLLVSNISGMSCLSRMLHGSHICDVGHKYYLPFF